MKKIILICLLILGIAPFAYAQKEMNRWYFGYKTGLNFGLLRNATASDATIVANMPTPVTGPVNTREGCFTLSDASGNLLMSSDGITVYNKNNVTMANGTALLGDPSAAQSGIVIPFPGSPNKYYIVTVAQMLTNIGINYSVVDMAANSGLGAVTATKNVNLLKAANTWENIAAVPHANGSDYWLVHRRLGLFYVWEITPSGFSAYAVYNAGSNPGPPLAPNTHTNVGCLKFDTSGTRLLHVSMTPGAITMARFNNSTGVISGAKVQTGTDLYAAYGVEFSTSGKYAYVTTLASSSLIEAHLFRVESDEFLAGTASFQQYASGPGNIQHYSDGRIYGIVEDSQDLYVIMNPESGGSTIKIIPKYLLAPSGLGLPTFPTLFQAKVTDKPFVCVDNNSDFSADITISGGTIVTHLLWDFGDGTSPVSVSSSGGGIYTQSHTYNDIGMYRISLTPYDGTTSLSDISTSTTVEVIHCNIKTNRMIRQDIIDSLKQP